MIILYILFLVISAIFNSQMDIIRDHPQKAWFNSGWWVQDNWQNQPFWRKTMFSFLMDGWHFCKLIMIYFMLLPFSYCVGVHISPWLFNILPYAFFGGIFEIIYSRSEK